jgi:hypothetical protein
MTIDLRTEARRALAARSGSVAIQIGLAMIVIVGMVGLGVEITYLLYKHRQMQVAADTAAFGGATAKAVGHPVDFALEAEALAANGGYVNGVNDVTVTVNSPPAAGNFTTNTSAVEVIVSQPQTLSMVTLFKKDAFNVGARAVAIPGGTGSACVLQLVASSMTGVQLSNGATVNLVSCGMDVNALGTTSLQATGGAILNAQFVSTSGKTAVSNGAVINATNGVKTDQAYVSDPYAAVPAPTYSGCTFNNKSYGHSNAGRQTISPGTYCNGLAFTNDAIVTMNPGVYIIDRGTFDVGGAVQLTGTGVTIYLTTSTGGSYAKVSIGNGATVNLTAPTSGNTAALVFFGDRSGSLSNTSSFGGGATLAITGAIYFPSQTVTFANGISNPSGCTQLVVGNVQFTGGSQFKNNCSGTGVVSVGGSKTILVE